MPDWLARLRDDLTRVWEKLPTAQKWLVGGLSAALVVALVAITLGIYLFPNQQLLASGLTPRELGHLSAWLQKEGIRFKTGDGGTSIYVYGDAPAILGRYALTAENKPLGGYRFLLGTQWSQTREQFDETRLRAHQEELEVAIVGGSDRIRSAKVFITPGKRGLFPKDTTKPTASVKLDTGGAGLDRTSVQGVQWLIASAVPGLDPGDVKVIDEEHHVLEGYRKMTEVEQLTTEQQTAERAYEKKLTEAIAAILDPIVGGPENRSISAIVHMDFDKLKIEETVLDSESPLETSIKREESEETNQPAGGVPGTGSNNTQSPLAGQNQGATGQSSKRTEEKSEITQEPRLRKNVLREVAPGAILGQQVSVVINKKLDTSSGETKYVDRTPEELKAIEEQLMTAVGHIQDNTRYHFSLKEMAFDKSSEQMQVARTKRENLVRNIESGILLLFAFALVGIFFYFLKKAFSLQPEELEPVAVRREEMEEKEREEDLLSQMGLRPIGEAGEELEPEVRKSRMMREQVQEFANEHPEEVADILRSWLVE